MPRQRPAFNRLALAAALLFAVWQGLSVQHFHGGDRLQTECAVCATAQLDDAVPVVVANIGSPALGRAEIVEFLTPRYDATALSAYGARAPPTS